jgi:hypothetical protein
MRLRVHLASMPWADPMIAPIQTACLKAYLDARFGRAVDVRTYAPFLQIPHSLKGAEFLRFIGNCPDAIKEHLSMFAYLRFFGTLALTSAELGAFWDSVRDKGSPDAATSFERAHGLDGDYRARLAAMLDSSLTDALARVTSEYLERELAPALGQADVDVIGFSLNYNQSYLSAFAATWLERRGFAENAVLLFGGGSASQPSVRSVFARLGVPGFIVFGEGERKLERVVRLAQESSSPQELRARIAPAITGVLPTSDLRDLWRDNPLYLSEQIGELGELPAPDYDEYFAALRSLCADDDAYAALRSRSSITVEGTRGCFAHCDFCSLNRQWFGFRKMPHEIVLRNVLAMRERYAVNFVHFADNVCDTWAEGYASALVARNLRVPALMELRSHHSESFWAKLALAGVSEIQIGVEAISGPLLANIGKGTWVYQNLRTQKYLAELGIAWSTISNLITHHPKSTVADAAQTRRVLELTPHFGLPNLSVFHLDPGSPLYNELTETEMQRGRPARRVNYPAVLEEYAVERNWEMPDRWCDDAATAAWDRFTAWYEGFRHTPGATSAALRVVECGEQRLWIQGRRNGRFVEFAFDGAHAAVYAACHHAPKLDAIVEQVDLDRARVTEIVARLLAEQLLIFVDDRYLALALRPRDELVANLWRSDKALAPAAAPREPAAAAP